MIEVKNLSFSYGRTEILKDISLTLEPGRLYAVIGPNGCGKTTLLRLLAALEKPKSGELLADGQPYCLFDRRALARTVSMMQQWREVPDMTVHELVCHGRHPYLSFPRRLGEKDILTVAEALSLADAEYLKYKNLRRLSGGERQRAYMAMLLAQDTPYLLLDEPSTYLDISASEGTLELLRHLADGGKCVVTVLHDLADALRFADCVAVMDSGRLRYFGAPSTELYRTVEEVFSVTCTPVDAGGETDFIFRRKR